MDSSAFGPAQPSVRASAGESFFLDTIASREWNWERILALPLMAKTTYLPTTDAGTLAMLVAFDTNQNALATKYALTAAEMNRVRQARYVWQWFQDALVVAREWAQSLTSKRDSMVTGPAASAGSIPGGPALPASPTYVPLPSGTSTAVLLEPGFFEFLSGIVARIKTAQNYDPADGVLLGIEGAVIPPPDPAIVPLVTGDVFHSGHPGLTCRKGVFDGYTVWLTRPGQARKQVGFSTKRHFEVDEPLPTAGTAEVWSFEVQYRYKGESFGQISQPLELAVRGV
jgi:hypothetical protein